MLKDTFIFLKTARETLSLIKESGVSTRPELIAELVETCMDVVSCASDYLTSELVSNTTQEHPIDKLERMLGDSPDDLRDSNN